MGDEPEYGHEGPRPELATPIFLAPWGSPGTPLLPRWYRDVLAAEPVPPPLRARNAEVETIADLDRFWASAVGPVGKDAMRALVDLARAHRPPPSYVVVPEDLGRSTLTRLPLRTRTSNGLAKAGLIGGKGPITAGDLLSITHFGITSLLDLMCVVESAVGWREAGARVRGSPGVDDQDGVRAAVDELITHLFAAASELLGATTVADALRLDLGRLAEQMGLTAFLDSVPIRDLTEGYAIAHDIAHRIELTLSTSSPAERLVLEERLFARDPSTLEVVAQQVGLSRERIRQIQGQLSRRIDSEVGARVAFFAGVLHEQLGPVVSEEELNRRLAESFGPDWEEGSIAGRMVRMEMGYACDDGICLDEPAMGVVRVLREIASKTADDVGLIDEIALKDGLPSDTWASHYDRLIQRCGFQRVLGRLSLRDTAKAHTKAAVLEIGRPATKEEIAAILDLDPDRIGGQLSIIPSIVRADKKRWGLADWVDDEYEGIPAEITQRILEDGGATSLDRLVEELPRLFGVSETSVRIYVGTPQFLLRDGYVSLADESSISLRDLEDVLHGRDLDDSPYWMFEVESRYFDGYSLAGFPPELARLLGCQPNGSARVHLVYPENCGALSVHWRLASATGPTLGYLAEPLRRLGVRPGERVRLVVKDAGLVELRPVRDGEATDFGEGTSPETILERMKNRRRVL